MNKAAWIAWAVRGSVSVLAFAGLAVWFDHWWIVLFAALFIPGLETEYTKTKSGEEEDA